MKDYTIMAEAVKIMDARYPMICACGKLATGLHTAMCRKFQKELNKEYERLMRKKEGGVS